MSFKQQCIQCGSKELLAMDAMYQCKKCGCRVTECEGCAQLHAELKRVKQQRGEARVWAVRLLHIAEHGGRVDSDDEKMIGAWEDALAEEGLL